MGKICQNPKIGNFDAPQLCNRTSQRKVDRYRKLPDPWTAMWSKQYLSTLHSVWIQPLAIGENLGKFGGPQLLYQKSQKISGAQAPDLQSTLSELLVLPIFDFRFWRQITPKVKHFENVFPDSATGHRNMFVTKFDENQPLRSCRKVAWFTKQKNSRCPGLVPALILPKLG